MRDVKRIRELRAAIDLAPHIPNRGEVEDALAELTRIKGAALSVPEIEERHSTGFPLASSVAHQTIGTLLDALRAKEACEAELRRKLSAQDAEIERLVGRLQTPEDQLAQAQKEIERLRNTLGMRVVSNLLAKFNEERTALWENFWGMLCISTNRENTVQEQLAQAERDKAAARAECEFLLKTRTELALKVPILEEGVQRYRIAHEEKNVHYRDVADAAVKEWERDHGALVPREGEAQKGQESKPEWLSELDRLAVKVHAILDGTDAGLPGEAELFKDLARLHNLRCVVLNGQGEAEVPRAVMKKIWSLWDQDFKATAGKTGFMPGGIGIHFDAPSGDNICKHPEDVLSAIDAAGAEILAAHRDAKPGDPDEDKHGQFRECDTCRAKPGSPALCPSCLARRAAWSERKRRDVKPENRES